MSDRDSLKCHRGSCLCGGYELRITERCLTEDLDLEIANDFAVALSHPIVQAFQSQLSARPIGGKTVGPASGARTLYRLGYGHDHRGATWYDSNEHVVWLCAYGLHRSGDPDDAFQYFQELLRSGEIWPTEGDYKTLFSDQGNRFVETVSQDAQDLLAIARSNPGVEAVGIIGGEETTGVVVEIVDTLEETYVVFPVSRIDYTRVVLLLAAFFPDSTFKEWELVSSFPPRPLRREEVCYRILHNQTSADLQPPSYLTE